MKRLVLLLTLCAAAFAHDLEDNRATLVLRDPTHLSVTLYLNYPEALHKALLPQRDYGAFLLIYSSMKPDELRKELLRAQAKFESTTQLTTPTGAHLKLSGWLWPDTKQVQTLLQQQVMQAMVDGHPHSAPQEIRADALAPTPIETLTAQFPPEFQKVLVVSYKPNQVWITGSGQQPPIRF